MMPNLVLSRDDIVRALSTSLLDRDDIARDEGRLPDADESAGSPLLSLAVTTKDNLPPARDAERALTSNAKV